MDNVELLKAKDAIFRLIGQYCGCFLGTDDNYYMSDYFESALERSFIVLGFDRDEVPLMEFCQAWEDNNRKLWAINLPDEEYRGSTARDYYNIFVKSYKRWADSIFEDAEYINREVLKNDIAKSTEPFNTGSVFRAINRQIAADVVPVVHGRWIRPHWKNNNYCCNCSECGGEAMHRDYQWNKNDIYPICPNCGRIWTEVIAMRLIDAREAKVSLDWTLIGDAADAACRVIDSAPTVDAVVVTRCKNCKYLRVWNQKDLYAFCPKTNTVFLPFELDTREHFCSLGKRKEGAD